MKINKTLNKKSDRAWKPRKVSRRVSLCRVVAYIRLRKCIAIVTREFPYVREVTEGQFIPARGPAPIAQQNRFEVLNSWTEVDEQAYIRGLQLEDEECQAHLAALDRHTPELPREEVSDSSTEVDDPAPVPMEAGTEPRSAEETQSEIGSVVVEMDDGSGSEASGPTGGVSPASAGDALPVNQPPAPRSGLLGRGLLAPSFAPAPWESMDFSKLPRRLYGGVRKVVPVDMKPAPRYPDKYEGIQRRILGNTAMFPVVPDGIAEDGKYSPVISRPYPVALHRPLHCDLQTDLRREAAEYGLDVELYTYAVLKGLLSGRNIRRFSELKSKMETFVNAHMADKPALYRTAQIIRVMALLQTQTVADKYYAQLYRTEGFLTIDGRIRETHMLNDFAKTGKLPSSGWFQRFIARQRAIPKD